MDREPLRVRILPSIGDIPQKLWDACACPHEALPRVVESASQRTHSATESPSEHLESRCEDLRPRVEPLPEDEPLNPFTTHAFLSALERSQSAVARTGWQPQHLLVETAAGVPRAVAPCYLKSHSRGEYVFDHGWAEAFERAGGRYYPKLQVCVPFTPVTGRRLLVATEGDTQARDALVSGLVELCRLREASSVHLTFLTADECKSLGALGFLMRTDRQFHWSNEEYGSFDDFLSALSARKRKMIARERREALAPGIEIDWLTGTDLTEAVWDAFFAFYIDTGSRKWGRPYLTRAFFSMIGESMADRILLVMARRGGRYIAGAINFIGDAALYGRHWGALEQHPFLHFELCYYQAIAFAITRGLRRVEAGAQGEHKLSRGYLPSATHSAHYIADPGLRRAVASYLERERAYVAAVGEELAEHGPFRRETR